MGLYVNHLDTVTIKGRRSLYVYLLDYGWPDGEWEQLFKRHFMKMADLASENNAVVIASPQGIHFANEVLSWHKFGDINAERHLPAILLTKTHPEYFENNADDPRDEQIVQLGIEDLLLVPLAPLCQNENDFVRLIENIFQDLKEEKALVDFAIADGNLLNSGRTRPVSRLVDSIELKPGIFGLKLDVKKLFGFERHRPQ